MAFSLSRALSTNWIGQNIVTLRRDSDDATMDFVAGENGLVDVAAVTAWLDGANGFVETVWDQSGNTNNYVQASTANQPPWVANAVNSHPAMQRVDIGGTPIELRCGAITYPNGGWTAFTIARGSPCRFYALNGGPPDTEFNASPPNLLFPIFALDNDSNECGVSATTVFNDDAYHLLDGTAKFGESDHYSDGQFDSLDQYTVGNALGSFTIDPSRWLIGGGNTFATSGSAELIVYPIFPTSPDRLAIRRNIAAYYGISLS